MNKAAIYSTHIPLLRAVLKVYKPRHVLELGSGTYSTVQLLRLAAESTSLEQDADWARNLSPLQDEKHRIIHMTVPAESQKKLWRIVPAPQDVLDEAMKQYVKHIRPDTDLLFVDHFGGFRLHAMQMLHGQVPVVMCHDVNEVRSGRAWHALSNVKLAVPRRLFASVTPDPLPHTGVMVPDEPERIEALRVAFDAEFRVWADAIELKAEPKLVETNAA